MNLRRLLQHLRRQDGISLVVAVGVLGLLSLTGTTLGYYATTNARSAEYSKDNNGAYDIAEAGINEMMAVLSNPSNNALDETLLPKTTRVYEGGTVTWWGVLDRATAIWSLTSIGEIANPTGPGSKNVTRTLTAKVPVTPTTTQPLNNPSWNYIMSTQVTGAECDMTIGNTVEVRTNLYVFGNLCLENQGKVLKGETHATMLVVKGKVTQKTQHNTIGTSTGPIAEVNIGQGCKWFTNAFYNECVTGDATKVYATTFKTDAESATLVAPIADFNAWYLNAAPGPYYPCASVSGTPPVFDSPVASATASDSEKLTYKNNNLSVQNLTPSTSSYSCKVGGGGELTWDHVGKVLTVSGTIYIDGDARIEFASSALVQYKGQGSLYLSGSLKLKNVKLCGGVLNGGCDFDSWDPNTQMLAFVTDGHNRQSELATGTGIRLLNSHLQGALYATHKIDIDTYSKVDGPVVGSEVILGQSVTTNDFPTITTVPTGMPGNPTVYAQPNPPELYSG